MRVRSPRIKTTVGGHFDTTEFVSGLSEPAGAFIAVVFLRKYLTAWLTTHVLACVAGIMVNRSSCTIAVIPTYFCLVLQGAVSILEIFPQGVAYKRPRYPTWFTIYAVLVD